MDAAVGSRVLGEVQEVTLEEVRLVAGSSVWICCYCLFAGLRLDHRITSRSAPTT